MSKKKKKTKEDGAVPEDNRSDTTSGAGSKDTGENSLSSSNSQATIEKGAGSGSGKDKGSGGSGGSGPGKGDTGNGQSGPGKSGPSPKKDAKNQKSNPVVDFVKFLKEVRIEVKKISWPERGQVIKETWSVVVLVTIITFLVLGYDYALGHFVFGPIEHWAKIHNG